jgi:hypothetical protein
MLSCDADIYHLPLLAVYSLFWPPWRRILAALFAG